MTDSSHTDNSASPVIDRLEALENSRAIHAHGGLAYNVLRGLEAILPADMTHTAETGCGRSTILFSNLSTRHEVFCIEDREYGDRCSVRYVEESGMTLPERLTWHFGPTQQTLPPFEHGAPYDCVLIDGPHGYPFPDLEYYFFYPHIRTGGYLIVDDIHIPSIGRMADIIQEDAMWEYVGLVSTTAVFRRTGGSLTDPVGDDWWTQNYNRRRIGRDMEFFLDDGGQAESFAARAHRVLRKQGLRHVLRRLLRR